jgi:hypothetical protein
MIRQYRIITKTPTTEFQQLEPMVHAALYNIPEVRTAIEFCQLHDNVEMVGLRLNTRLYSIVVIYADKLLENHFSFNTLNNKES